MPALLKHDLKSSSCCPFPMNSPVICYWFACFTQKLVSNLPVCHIHNPFLFPFFCKLHRIYFPQGSCLLPLICSSNLPLSPENNLSGLHIRKYLKYLGTFLFWNIWNIWVSFLFWNNIIEYYKYILFLYNYIIFILFVIIILIYSYYHLFYFPVCQNGQI